MLKYYIDCCYADEIREPKTLRGDCKERANILVEEIQTVKEFDDDKLHIKDWIASVLNSSCIFDSSLNPNYCRSVLEELKRVSNQIFDLLQEDKPEILTQLWVPLQQNIIAWTNSCVIVPPRHSFSAPTPNSIQAPATVDPTSTQSFKTSPALSATTPSFRIFIRSITFSFTQVETGIASNKIMTAKLLASSLKSSSTPL
jgi:hypothetical protein